MAVRVWVDAWQMQCCGDPFQVGGDVSWSLYLENDHAFLGNVATPEIAESIQFGEEHHGGIPEDSPETRGEVLRIQVAHCRVGQAPGGDPNMHVPLQGTGTLRDVDSADGWDAEQDGLIFYGYIVDIEPARGQSLPSK